MVSLLWLKVGSDRYVVGDRYLVTCFCMLEAFWKRCWHVYVLEAMSTCFVLFRPGTILILRGRRARGCRTGIIAGFAQCVFQEAFLCCQALAGSDAATFTFWKQCLHVFASFALAQRGKRLCTCLIKKVLEAIMACFRIFCFRPTLLSPNVGRGLVHI